MENRIGSHTTSRISAHIIWCTKYRFKVLDGEVQTRCRDLLVQVFNSEDVKILKGVVSKDHVHMHIEYPPRLSVSDIVKRLKGPKFSDITDRVSPLKKALLGKTFLGNRLWSVEHRSYNRRNGSRIFGASQR